MMLKNIGSKCLAACDVTCTQPYAYSSGLDPCVASCGDSRAMVYAPPVVLTFPGPILSSCSQKSIVRTSFPQLCGALTPYSSGESYGMGGSSGSGGTSGIGDSFGYGGSSGIRGSFGSGGSFGYGGMSGMGSSFGSRGSFGYGGMLGMRGSFGSGGSFRYGGFLGMGGCYSRRSYSSICGSRLGNCGSF